MESYRHEIRQRLLSVTPDSRPSVPKDGPKPKFLVSYEGIRSNSEWTLCSPQSSTQMLIQARVLENW